jgi:hypothetical protein
MKHVVFKSASSLVLNFELIVDELARYHLDSSAYKKSTKVLDPDDDEKGEQRRHARYAKGSLHL